MPLWQAIILGAVQGLTEFLPISSTAHLALVPWLFGWRDPGLTFDVALHLGTLVAVLIYFWKTWVRLGVESLGGGRGPSQRFDAGTEQTERTARTDSAVTTERTLFVENSARTENSEDSERSKQKNSGASPPAGGVHFANGSGARSGPSAERGDGKLFWWLVAGTIPAGVAGLLFEKQVETTLRSPLVIGVSLITLAFIMAYGDSHGSRKKQLGQVTLRDAVLIGVSQALALIPGVSRSGITITTGLLLNYQRDASARFSFLLSTPIIAGACLIKLLEVYNQGLADEMVAPFILGVLSSAVVGYATIAFFIKFLQFGTFRIFVYYRVILGIMVLALAMLFRLNFAP